MITIIDYNAGNIRSVENALKRLDARYIVTFDPEIVCSAEKIIFPGVGAAKDAMEQLQNRGLVEVIKSFNRPFLGICLGMQLLYEFSEEGNTACLSIVEGSIRRFPETNKVPHIGWNTVDQKNNSPLIKDITASDYFYFVHSYYAPLNKYTVNTSDYATQFTSVVQKNNFYGTQFHPEKSGKIGEKILINFLNL